MNKLQESMIKVSDWDLRIGARFNNSMYVGEMDETTRLKLHNGTNLIILLFYIALSIFLYIVMVVT